MRNFFEKLRKYFEETPQEIIREVWARTAELDEVGPTVEDFLAHPHYYHICSGYPNEHFESNLINEFGPEFSSGFFLPR